MEEHLLRAANLDVVDDGGIVGLGHRHNPAHHLGAGHVARDSDGIGERPHAKRRVRELRFQQILEFPSVGQDDHVDRVHLAVVVPQRNVGDPRLFKAASCTCLGDRGLAFKTPGFSTSSRGTS